MSADDELWHDGTDEYRTPPGEPEPLLITCPEPVWDGPYRMRCGGVLVDGACGRHGKIKDDDLRA